MLLSPRSTRSTSPVARLSEVPFVCENHVVSVSPLNARKDIIHLHVDLDGSVGGCSAPSLPSRLTRSDCRAKKARLKSTTIRTALPLRMQFVWVKSTGADGRVTGTFALSSCSEGCEGLGGSSVDHRGVVFSGAALQKMITNARNRGILYITWQQQVSEWRAQSIRGRFTELVEKMNDAFDHQSLPDTRTVRTVVAERTEEVAGVVCLASALRDLARHTVLNMNHASRPLHASSQRSWSLQPGGAQCADPADIPSS